MSRPGEVSHQIGNDAQFEAFVRAEFPQCIAKDEDGADLVPTQYTSAYDHDVGIHYIAQLLLERGEYDEDGNEITPPVFGDKALLIDWHREPEKTEQDVRISTRLTLFAILEDPETTPENKRRAAEALEVLRTSSYAGIEARTPTTIAWAGSAAQRPDTEETPEETIERVLNGSR